MNSEDYGPLEALRDVLNTSRAFHQAMRSSARRDELVALQLRNDHLALHIVRAWLLDDSPPGFDVVIPLRGPSNFADNVPVTPSAEQITRATELRENVTDTQCAICQEEVTTGATRVRHCGHCFHSSCIQSWFQLSVRCPVCRYDIRDFQAPPSS